MKQISKGRKSKEKTINLLRWRSCTKTKAKIKTQNNLNNTNRSYEISSDEYTKPKKKATLNKIEAETKETEIKYTLNWFKKVTSFF